MTLADLWADSRQERQADINKIKQEVSQWKKQTKAERNLLKEELQIQAQENRQTLNDFIADLQQQGNEDRTQRQQDRQQRQNQNSTRQSEVAQLMEEFAKKRAEYRVELSTNAGILGEQLQDFHQNLQNSVWGIASNISNIATSSSPKSPEIKTQTKVATSVEPTIAKTSPAKSQTREEAIYQLVKESEGISLSEIEQKLNLERKFTIEIIRKLIKEQKLEQRDRLYFAI